MKIDEVAAVTAILNGMLLGLDQSATPERRQAAERYAEMMHFLSSELNRRIALLEAGQRHEATLCCRGETPLPELARQAKLADGRRYRELCRLYDWPLPLQLNADQLQRLADAGGSGISLRDLLNRWRNEAGSLPPAEKLSLLRRIRQLDPAHESHWLGLFPEVEKEYCRELQEQAAGCEDEAVLAAIAKEVLTAEWVSPAAAELRDGIVTKLRRIQMDARHRRLRHELDRLADAASCRDLTALTGALQELQVLQSDPDCPLSEAELLQLNEAQKLAGELTHQQKILLQGQGLTAKIHTALDEGASYATIAEDYHALLESGAVIDTELSERVQAAQTAFQREQRARMRRRWCFAFFVTAAAAALIVWIVLKTNQENCLRECVTATAEFLRTDRPHDAASALTHFLKKYPAVSGRSVITLRQREIAAALEETATRNDRFDQLLTVLTAPPRPDEEKEFRKRFRKLEKALDKLPTADDAVRQQRLAELRNRAAREEEEALRQRESETLRLCDRWRRQLTEQMLSEEEVRRISFNVDQRRHPEPPLTVLEKEALDGCLQLLTAFQEARKNELNLLDRLPRAVTAGAYLSDRTTLSRSAYREGMAAAWRATDEWLPVWNRIAAFRITPGVYVNDREANDFLQRLPRDVPERALNQTISRLFPADKRSGQKYLTDFQEILKKWEKTLTSPPYQDLHEIVLVGPQQKKYRLFSRGPVRIERSGRGQKQPLAMQLDALPSPTSTATERLTFRWQQNSRRLERVGQEPRIEVFQGLPLSFLAVDGSADLTQLAPQKARHVQLGLEAIALLKKCQDRDEALTVTMQLLATLARDQQLESLFKAEFAGILWSLASSVEPLAGPAADRYAGELAKIRPPDWNWCDPLLPHRQPRIVKALAALPDPKQFADRQKELTERRRLERLAMLRFPRPAGILLRQKKGGSSLHLFSGTTEAVELWVLTEDANKRFIFKIVKEHGKKWQDAPELPHGMLLFAPADDRPTPAVDPGIVLPQCWPVRKGAR